MLNAASAPSPNSAPNNAPTLQLPHDIILPDDIGLWPLAYGWWILMAIVLLSLGALCWYWWQRRRALAPFKNALRQLTLFAAITDDRRYLSDCAHWLKRQAIAFHGREQAAALNGEAWLKFLDETGDTNAFSQGDGRILLSLYHPRPFIKRDALHSLLEAWLRQQFEQQRKGHKRRV